MKKRIRYFLIGGSLFVALLIYLILREKSSPFYRQAANIGLTDTLNKIRNNPILETVPSWIVNSLPDGLWMFSLVLFIMALWDFRKVTVAIFWVAVAIICGLLFELVQLSSINQGRFDWMDVGFIVAGALLALSLNIKSLENEETY